MYICWFFKKKTACRCRQFQSEPNVFIKWLYKTWSTKLSSNVYSMQGLFFETSQLMTTYRLVLPPGIALQLISKIPAWPPSYDNLRLRAAVCSFLIFFQLKMDWCSLENKCPFCIHWVLRLCKRRSFIWPATVGNYGMHLNNCGVYV